MPPARGSAEALAANVAVRSTRAVRRCFGALVGIGGAALCGCATFLDDDFVFEDRNGGNVTDSGTGGASARPEGGAPEAGTVPPGTCPADCSSCADGTCVLEGAKKKNVVCPTGMPCRVECATKSACESVRCAPGQRCTITCTTKEACNASRIDGNAATSLCLLCAGDPGCKGLLCSALPASCSKVCTGGGCDSIGACGACGDVSSCP